jgi:hypothetical protein
MLRVVLVLAALTAIVGCSSGDSSPSGTGDASSAPAAESPALACSVAVACADAGPELVSSCAAAWASLQPRTQSIEDCCLACLSINDQATRLACQARCGGGCCPLTPDP